MRRIVLMFVLLAACSKQDDYDDATELSGKDAKAAAAIANEVAVNGAASATAAGLPVSPRLTVARGMANALPVAFQGYWGAKPDDCDLANTAAAGRIDVEGDTIRFYESKARIAKTLASAPAAVTADLTFSGEGQRSTRRMTLTLVAGGTALLRQEQGQATTLRYSRC